MGEEEDFSFPTTTDAPPRFIGSPPLWRTNTYTFAASLPETPKREYDDRQEDCYCNYCESKKVNSWHRRKSFSHVERGTKKKSGDDSSDDDEKMDMLWEDFNHEEFSSRNSMSTIADSSDHMPRGRMLNIGCVQALKLSKASKRPSIVVFMKVLKKMFFHQQNSHRSIKKSKW